MTQMLVTGGTGQLGRALVAELIERGHRVRITSRSAVPPGADPQAWAQVDWSTGAGLLTALAGVDVVVHCASGSPKGERVTMTALLATARQLPRPPHLVYISIVGIDDLPMTYYRAKLRAEQALVESGLPHTILRATQFHTLVEALVTGLSKVPLVLPIPKGLVFQPIGLAAVAGRLAELAESPPAGRVDDLGGPEIVELPELARMVLRAKGKRRWIAALPLPGKLMRAMRAGANTTPAHATPGQTFAEYLTAR